MVADGATVAALSTPPPTHRGNPARTRPTAPTATVAVGVEAEAEAEAAPTAVAVAEGTLVEVGGCRRRRLLARAATGLGPAPTW